MQEVWFEVAGEGDHLPQSRSAEPVPKIAIPIPELLESLFSSSLSPSCASSLLVSSLLDSFSSAPNIVSFVLTVFYSGRISGCACIVADVLDLGSALNVRFEYMTFCLNLTTDGISH